MAPFSTDAWLLIGAFSVICLLAFLYSLSALYRDQTKLHDLKLRVHDLRREYAERLARERAEEIIEVAEVVGHIKPGA